MTKTSIYNRWIHPTAGDYVARQGLQLDNTFTAVDKTVGDRAVSVTDYGGAMGDGNNNDTAAIQATLDNNPNRTIYLPPGNYKVTTPLTYSPGQNIIGAGPGRSTITYTGTGTCLAPKDPAVRTYNGQIAHLNMTGPGKATASVGVSLESVTEVHLMNVIVAQFGTGFRLASAIGGGSVYNTFHHVTASQCTTGYDIAAAGSNNTRLIACRAAGCITGVNITDSNNVQWMAGSFEANTTGVKVTASLAGLGDYNLVFGARFEGNSTAWNVTSANVRDFQMINPQVFGTYTFADSGSRTTHWGNTLTAPNKTQSIVADANGSWRFERIVNASQPAMVVADTATASGTPVTIQAQTERNVGSFFRGVIGGNVHYDVRADGVVTRNGDIFPYRTLTASGNIIEIGSATVPGDGVVIGNGTNITITLPNPTTTPVGRQYTIKNVNSSTATLNSQNAATIDGQASILMAQNDTIRVINNGNNWWRI